MSLKGQMAIVTGGGSGIGRAIVETFAEAGISGITVVDTNRKAAEEVAQYLQNRYGCSVIASEADVSKKTAVEEMVAAAVEAFGRVDILVNNAGICSVTPWDEVTLESWNHILEVNLTGAFLCTKQVVPLMKQRQYGRIVYITSIAAFQGSLIAHVAYGVSKAGMVALMKSVAKELATEGINANAIAPGTTDTPMTDSFGSELKGRLAESTLLKRRGTPREIADAALFLVSSGANYMTGATLHVNGGALLA
jgi:3-oxoacyl-[acyl-carrier protein] reductase